MDNSQRIFLIEQMIKENRIQGAIYHVLRGCLVYDYEYQIMEEEVLIELIKLKGINRS